MVQRVLEVGRLLGWRRVIELGPRWLVHREFLVFSRDLTVPLPAHPSPPDLRWADLTEEDWPKLTRAHPMMGEREIRRRTNEQQRCLVGWVDDAVVYYQWDTMQPIFLTYLGRPFRPAPGECFADAAGTSPLWRSRGLGTVGLLQSFHRARVLGCRRATGLVAWFNEPSIRIARRLNRVLEGRVGYWGAGALRHYYTRAHVRFESGSLVVPSPMPWTEPERSL